ncbi:protein SRC2 homolog [Morus notabilis]|nr:protein SRC2 homolog [Morus notabilis]
MDYRAFDINLASLEGLKSQKFSLFKIKYYAVVTLVATSISRQKSRLGKSHEGGKCHIWNHPMRFYANESKLQQNSIMLMVQIRRRRAFCMDKDVGKVCVPLKQLYDKSLSQNGNNINNVGAYRVVTASRKYKGSLCFSFTFSNEFRRAVRKNSGEDGSSTLRRSVARRHSVSPSAP